jgi:hypothetical protein
VYALTSLPLGDLAVGGSFFTAAGQPAANVAHDNSTATPVLNVADFSCFLNQFAASDTHANCDGSPAPPAINVQDCACFLNRFAAGCS